MGSRVSLEEIGGNTIISISVKKNFIQVAISFIQIIFVVVIAQSVFLDPRILVPEDYNFAFGIDAFIILFISYIMVEFTWMLFGRENIEFDRSTLQVRYSIFSIGLKNSFDNNRISNFRYEKFKDLWANYKGYTKGLFGKKMGNIRFTYDGKTKMFGLDITEDEAKQILAVIEKTRTNFREHPKSGTHLSS